MAAFVRSVTASGTSTTPSGILASAPPQNDLLSCFIADGVATLSAGINSYQARTEVVTASSRRAGFFDKLAGAGESATQAPCTLGASVVWGLSVLEYSAIDTTTRLDVENAVADGTANKTSPTVNPTDNIDVLVLGAGFANSGSGTFSAQTINGSTAGVTERTDVAAGRASSVWDWFGNTSTNTFASVGTSSSGVTEGGGHIVIYRAAAAALPPGLGPKISMSPDMQCMAQTAGW